MMAKFHYFSASVAVVTFIALPPLSNAQTDSEPKAGPPHIISSSPKDGATDVDPAVKEITVTFDRDMDSGMSWTGGGPSFPNSPPGAKARWRTKRTCVLPVALQSGRFYRVGINSMNYRNFCSADGVPAPITSIHFTTSGPKAQIKAPSIISLNPPNGARDVNASITELRVTFDVPMAGGFSWTGDGPKYPEIPNGKKPFWTDGGTTCVLPVQLKPGCDYELGLNSRSYHGFRSADGIPLQPMNYAFRTSSQP